ncbi:STAS domain-containing protein [Streptomyces sp. IB2014 016-6]|uniref:STAS domain-containing protein n=1 Tax=Streptomyces sp. IB2014 016-6 TaxID=2517818 RepID=UPI0011CB6FC5|nr:STAS domain-containing protein [Streptomyces sp. IB2014 016-6]TXL88120.1 anti-sigma factor antagonist [Streptomyces sp. IB2014 016-6]
MTTIPPAGLLLTVSLTNEHTVCVSIEGDLDYDSSQRLLDEARRQLSRHTGTRHLRLDCSRLVTCDSMGLATLLAVHRVTDAAGVRLHLDGRPASLDRILRLTGTLRHLTDPPAGAGSVLAEEQQDVPGGEHS